MKPALARALGGALHYVAAPALWLVAFAAALVVVESAWNLWDAVAYFGWSVFSKSNDAGITFLTRLELGALVCVLSFAFAGAFWRAYEPRSAPKAA